MSTQVFNHRRQRPASSHLRGWQRPTLVAMAAVVGLGLIAGWGGRSAQPATWQLLAVGAGYATVATWLRTSRRRLFVERAGAWAVLGVTLLATAATGGAASPYRLLLLLPMFHAAVFGGTAAVVGLGTVGTAGALLLGGGAAAGNRAETLVLLCAWGGAAVLVHVLIPRLDSAAQTDGLTGLLNHAAFWRRLHAEDARARRTGSVYSVLLLDVDRFKALNDRYGHQAGDAVLRRMAAILSNRVRGSDVLARYGGEEFAVLLPDTGVGDAVGVAEKLRRLLVVGGISVSIGVADNRSIPESSDAVVAAADAALYRAKDAGRARVMWEPAVDEWLNQRPTGTSRA